MRSNLQKAIYVVINPVVRFFIKAGLTPNSVTITGLVLNIAVAIVFIRGAEEGNRGDLSYVGWAGALVLFAGLFDMLDGQVARLGNMGTVFGALFDSVLDRYSELILFLGICYYLVGHHYFFSSLFAFIAMIGSMMVSYIRARAEGLGIECKGGLMQRPERVVTVGLSALACGISSRWIGGDYKLFVPGISFHVFETMSIFTIPITIMAVLTNLTAIRRLNDCRAAMKERASPGKVKSSSTLQAWFVVLLTMAGAAASAQQKAVADIDTFPVPVLTPNQMFYLHRTPNANTLVCELNYKNGVINKEEPVHVFWIQYAGQQQKKELSSIQRNFAYGIKSRALGEEKYELYFVSYPKVLLYLEPSPVDKKYNVYTTIAGKKAVLRRIFIKTNGGSFWSPNVEFIELKGIDPKGGNVLLERIKV